MTHSVLFIDHETWEAFSALAGALRTRGIRTSRITARPVDLKRRLLEKVERIVYGPTRALVETVAIRGSTPTLAVTDSDIPVGTVDIQATDHLAHQLLSVVPEARETMPRTSRNFDAQWIYDKSRMNDLAQQLGVPIPKALSEPGPLDFPVVVKGDLGSSGDRVRLAPGVPELRRAVEELRELSGTAPFVQAYHRFGQVNVGAVALNGELLVAVAYRSEPSPDDPHGPPDEVVAVDREDVVEATRLMANAMGATGFLCLNFVLDQDDVAYFIDYNPRAFGSWPALQSLGADFIGNYIYALGLGPRPSSGTTKLDCRESLLRFPASADTWGKLFSWVGQSLRIVVRRYRFLGWRWAVLSVLKILAMPLLFGVRRLQRPRRPQAT